MWYKVCEERKQFDAMQMGLYECLAATALLRNFRTECESAQVPVPEWLTARMTLFGRRIRDLKADMQAYRLAQINGQLAMLQNPDEKRAALLKEKADLEAASAS